MSHILICQIGYEEFLARECRSCMLTVASQGEGWCLVDGALPEELCFCRSALVNAQVISGASVNELASAVVDAFLKASRQHKFIDPWPFIVEHIEIEGLSRRASGLEKEVLIRLGKIMSRVAKLAATQEMPVGVHTGLGIFCTDFKQLYMSSSVWYGGQRRMRDDPLAPSRSYLKVEEAYGALGDHPIKGDVVVDLGAAPGGWSYSAACHGAEVLAIDNGPLKGGALNHSLIRHLREDAFVYTPVHNKTVDWLFCDMVEDPKLILELMEKWISQRLCRSFIVNLKFGRSNPQMLLDRLRNPESFLSIMCHGTKIRHLYHDREEITVMGHVR